MGLAGGVTTGLDVVATDDGWLAFAGGALLAFDDAEPVEVFVLRLGLNEWLADGSGPPLAAPDDATDGVAVTVAVTVTVGTGDDSSASRGSVRGGSTTTPTRSSALKSTYGTGRCAPSR